MSTPESRKVMRVHRRHLSTRYLLAARDMERVLTKERMRCDRHGHFFSLIVIHLRKNPKHSDDAVIRVFARILRKRLRLTDEKGFLLKGGIGVMLPMTPSKGARKVLHDLVSIAHQKEIQLDASIFTYADSDEDYRGIEHNDEIDQNSGDASDSGSSVLDTTHREDDSEQDLVTSIEKDAHGVTAIERRQLERGRVVRADRESQMTPDVAKVVFQKSALPLTYLAPRYPLWKRSLDIIGASIGLAAASPVLVGAAVAIKLSSRGPIFFKQMRTGQFGRPFAIYKLRTMVVNAEELKTRLMELNERDGPAFKMKDDPRVTTLGKFFRKTGIDELPQLWNVLIGDMSIVGPRPLPCNEDAQCLPWQRRRLDTKPGLTCIWQISKSRKVSFEDWMRMDLKYSDSRSLLHDVALMCKTVMAVVLGRVGH